MRKAASLGDAAVVENIVAITPWGGSGGARGPALSQEEGKLQKQSSSCFTANRVGESRTSRFERLQPGRGGPELDVRLLLREAVPRSGGKPCAEPDCGWHSPRNRFKNMRR